MNLIKITARQSWRVSKIPLRCEEILILNEQNLENWLFQNKILYNYWGGNRLLFKQIVYKNSLIDDEAWYVMHTRH